VLRENRGRKGRRFDQQGGRRLLLSSLVFIGLFVGLRVRLRDLGDAAGGSSDVWRKVHQTQDFKFLEVSTIQRPVILSTREFGEKVNDCN